MISMISDVSQKTAKFKTIQISIKFDFDFFVLLKFLIYQIFFLKTFYLLFLVLLPKVRNCRLEGMPDLRLDSTYVQSKISDFLNYMISLGVAGFRIDASKHMWPSDLKSIYANLNYLRSEYVSMISFFFIE